MDRLEPARVVEILEILKIFLESKNWVFVLAIDYVVVLRGVKAKYGDDFDEEKGRNFFDKIIQMPFQLPVGNYNLESFIDSCIDETNIGANLKKHCSKLISLIETSIGKNPRGIKRVFNALLLLKMVDKNNLDSKNIFDDEVKTVLLFAMLCLQQSCPPIYDFFAMNKDSIDSEKFLVLKTLDYGKIGSELEIDIKPEELEKIKRFIPELYNLVDSDGSGDISEDTELPVFRDVLALSAVTGNAGEDGRYTSKDISDGQISEFCTYKDNTPGQYSRFISAIESTCPLSHITRKRTNSGYIIVHGDFDIRGTSFCEFEERASGVAVWFAVPSKGLFAKLPDELKMRIENTRDLKEKNTRIHLDAFPEEDMEFFKKMVFFCYEMTLNKNKKLKGLKRFDHE